MKPRIVIVHGIRVRSALDSVGRLEAMLEEAGFVVHKFTYGWAGMLAVRFGSSALADALISFCRYLEGEGPVVVIGHSNGCNLINRAAWLAYHNREAPPFERCFYLSPALDRDTELAPTIKRCDVYHTRHDWVVRLAAWLAWHPFGDMGSVGYTGTDYRHFNFNGAPMVRAHSGWASTVDGLAFLKFNLLQQLLREYP